MNSKKNASSARSEQKESVTISAGSLDSQAMRHLIEADAAIAEESTPKAFAKQIERQTSQAFYDAVSIWRIEDFDSPARSARDFEYYSHGTVQSIIGVARLSFHPSAGHRTIPSADEFRIR